MKSLQLKKASTRNIASEVMVIEAAIYALLLVHITRGLTTEDSYQWEPHTCGTFNPAFRAE